VVQTISPACISREKPLFLPKKEMTYQDVTIKIPGTVQITPFELVMQVAAQLYERGVLSAGQAADLAGVSKRTFIELLGQYNVSVFGYQSLAEIEDEAVIHG
jgi:predicted HTH domain antitoxin